MAIKISFNGATILRPGAYSKTSINLLGGYPLSETGIVGIVGEAVGGPPGDDSTSGGVQSFYSTQMADLMETYESGPIVDVARALISPARDGRIPNGAQLIRVWKTNSSVKADEEVKNIDTVQDVLYDIDAFNWGESGNLINFYITEGSEADDEGTITSDADITFPVTITSADTFVITNKGVTYTCTFTTAPGGSVAIATLADLITLLNGTPVVVGADTCTPVWAPSKPAIFAASGTARVTFTIDPAVVTAYNFLHEYAMVTVDTGLGGVETDLKMTTASTVNATTLAVTAGSAGPVRGSRGNRIFVINKNDRTETIDENDNDVYMTLYYTGAAATATMSILTASGRKRLRTSCAGVAADDLDIDLSAYTIQELVTYLNNLPVYTCVTSYGNAATTNATWFDWYNAIDIKTLPIGIKGAHFEIESNVNEQSQLVVLEAKDDVYGAVETISSTAKRYLAGGALGASLNSDFQDGFDALLTTRCNTAIPCISQDATDDITDGVTDASSTYTIAAVILQADSHCRLASNTKNRSERNCYVGFLDSSFSNCKNAARNINSEFTTMAIQEVDFLDEDGDLVRKQPHVLAAMFAGMQAGTAVGEPITYKYVNAYGLYHEDYDVRADIDDAINAGLCVVEQPDSGGYRVVVGNTTYGKDANFVFNRISVLEVAHYIAYNLRIQLEDTFIGSGRRGDTATAQSVYGMVTAIMANFAREGLLVPDEANGYRGYKDLSVSVDGSTVYVDVTITPLQGIDFILARITLDNIRDNA